MEFSHAKPSKLNPIFGQFAQNPAEADASDSFISYFLNPVYKNELESRCNYNLGWNLILPMEFNFTKWNLKFQLTIDHHIYGERLKNCRSPHLSE